MQQSCKGAKVLICAQGGGGGMVHGPSGCMWNGGFSVQGAAQDGITLWAAPRPDRQFEYHSIRVTSRTSSECVTASGAGTDIVGQAARQCSGECAVSTSFNACYCPCFKNLLAGHVSWAQSITCAP